MTDLPDGWTVVELGEVALPDAPSEIPANLPTRPYVGLDSVEKETGHLLGLSDPSEFTSSSYAIEPGVVLYSRLRPNLNKVLLPTQSLYVSREFIPLNPCGDLSAAFLAPRLRAQDFVEFAIGLNAGDRPRVKWPQMKRFKLKLPPPEEQDEIVRILDTQLARLDAVLGAVQAVRDRADQLRRSLLHAAFNETVPTQATSASSRLGNALDLLIDHRGKTPKKLGSDFTASGIRVISAVHIKNRQVHFEERHRFVDEPTFRRWMPDRTRQGDVLMTSEAPLGAVALVPDDNPLVLSQRLFCLRGKDGVLRNEFLRCFLESPIAQEDLTRRSSGTTVTGIRQSELTQLLVPVPPIEVQEEIVRILDTQFARLDKALVVADQVERECGRLRRSLLQAAFTGELTKTWREANG